MRSPGFLSCAIAGRDMDLTFDDFEIHVGLSQDR